MLNGSWIFLWCMKQGDGSRMSVSKWRISRIKKKDKRFALTGEIIIRKVKLNTE